MLATEYLWMYTCECIIIGGILSICVLMFCSQLEITALPHTKKSFSILRQPCFLSLVSHNPFIILIVYFVNFCNTYATLQAVKYRMWENFGGGKFWRINGSKVFGEEKFGESVSSLLKTLAFINIGGENFGELPTVRQICQNFPPPKFFHAR